MLIFSLPDSWKEEDDPGDGVDYFEGDAEHGSLHVSLTTMQHPEGINEALVRTIAQAGREPGDTDEERLENGNFLRRFERADDGDSPQHTTFWMVVNAIPPVSVQYAIFNYGVPMGMAGTDVHSKTSAMLDAQIRLTTFTTLTPEEIKARHAAARPWWKFW